MRNRRSSYKAYLKDNVACVEDLNDGGLSVTNDVEQVTADVLKKFPNIKKIIYKDTTGRWDQILFDAHGFKGFSSLNAQTVQDALAKVNRLKLLSF